jgi:hypothetical protein
MSYLDIREPGTNHLLFRYDPTRRLIEIKNRERLTVIDLEEIPVNQPALRHPSTLIDTHRHPLTPLDTTRQARGASNLGARADSPTKGGDLKLL